MYVIHEQLIQHVNYMNAVPAGLRHHALKDGDTMTLNFQ